MRRPTTWVASACATTRQTASRKDHEVRPHCRETRPANAPHRHLRQRPEHRAGFAETPAVEPNRQGNDIGTSYRSDIFYLSDAQKQTAEDTIADVNASGLWPGKVVTEVTPAGPFWEAEPEHQDYLQQYPDGYTCHFVRPGWKLPRRAEQVKP